MNIAAVLLVLASSVTSPPALAPAELQERIASAHPDSRVEVLAERGILLLRGSVTSEKERESIGAEARRAGYARVANLVVIVPPPTDDELRRKVEQALRDARALEMREGISVRVANGVVHIGGTIPTELQRTVLEMIGRIQGVRQVVIGGEDRS